MTKPTSNRSAARPTTPNQELSAPTPPTCLVQITAGGTTGQFLAPLGSAQPEKLQPIVTELHKALENVIAMVDPTAEDLFLGAAIALATFAEATDDRLHALNTLDQLLPAVINGVRAATAERT